MWKWDAKAGYHLLFIHPSCWKYLCFSWQGKVCCWTCLPFGLQSACRTYSITLGELHRLEREVGGGLLSFVIDDKLGAARTVPEACFRSLTGVMMMAAAGICFGADKCSLWPMKLLKWLGMLLHTSPSVFYSIPEDKLAFLHSQVAGLIQQGSCTAQQLASLAGLLVSVAPATPLQRLLERALYLVIRERRSWEEAMPVGSHLLNFLCWLEPLVRPGSATCINGSCWLKEPRPLGQLQLVVDASATAFAGCLLKRGSLVQRIQITFSAEQQAAVQQQQWGSTPRETMGLHLCCKALDSRTDIMQQLEHTRLRIVCDSQGTIQVMESLGGSTWEQLAEVKAVWCWLLRHDIQPVFAWQPRESAEVQLADTLSKQPDSHDWVLQQETFDSLCSRQLPADQQLLLGSSTWGQPTVDLFAGAGAHKCSRFVTPYLCSGAARTDAFTMDWGQEQLAYIFAGPLFPAGQLLRKVLHDRCSCILVVPRWHKHWRALLVGPHVRDSVDLKYHDTLYTPGPFVPAHLRLLRIPLIAYRIDFSGI
jgi:hypothetical protein